MKNKENIFKNSTFSYALHKIVLDNNEKPVNYEFIEVNKAFEELTGLSGIHFHIIQHHRLKDWGEECPDCGHLLRTPKAKFCANCGRRKEQVPNNAF